MARDKERKRVYNKWYRETHRQEAREYRAAHREEKNARDRTRYYTRGGNHQDQSRYKMTHKTEIASYNREYKIKSYGLSVDDYGTLLARQDGVCAICGNPPKSGINLSIDHNHVTNQVRGLLCWRCNLLLGNANDNTEILAKAIEYLISPSCERG
jgi:hypothetical protein